MPLSSGPSSKFLTATLAVLILFTWSAMASALNNISLTVTTGSSKGEIEVEPHYSPGTDPNFQGCVVVRSKSSIGWNVDQGQIFFGYSAGQEVASGVVVAVVYGAGLSTYVDKGLEPGVRYYYKAWAHDRDYTYSGPDSDDALANGAASSIPNPTNISAEPRNRKIALYFTPPVHPDYATILIARGRATAAFSHWYPTDGEAYAVSDVVGGEGLIICNANVNHFTDVNLDNYKTYRFRIFTATTDHQYSGGFQIEIRPAKETTSHYYEFVREFGSSGTGDGQFSADWGPRGIAWETNGDISVADPGNLRLVKFDKNGDFVRATSPEYELWVDAMCTFGPNIWENDDIKFGGMGQHLTGQQNRADWITQGELRSLTYDNLSVYGSYASTCMSWRNNLHTGYDTFYACTKENLTVYELDYGVNIWRQWDKLEGTGNGQFNSGPVSIVQGRNGFLYIGDETGRIQKFTVAGVFKAVVETLPEVPLDMCVDQWGNFFVVTSGNKVLKYDPEWNFLTGWGRSGSGPGEFNGAKRIAVDRCDRVYVSDSGNHRVQVFIESDRNGSDIVYDAYIAEPVNTQTGNFSYEHTDLVVPGRGIGVSFSRTYNAQSSYIGALGWGWRHSYEIVAAVRIDDSVAIEWGDGHEEIFVPDGVGGYDPAFPWIYSTLEKNPGDGSFTLTTRDQTEYYFSSTGLLQTIMERNGNTLTFSYNALGRLTTLTDASGQTFEFAYGGTGNLSSITDPASRVTSFEMDSDGNLAEVTDARGNTERYEYDANHQMLRVFDRRGNRIIENVYDGYARVIQQTNALGAVTQFEYVPVTPATPWAYSGVTHITDALGNVTTHEYDSKGRLYRETDSLGNVRQLGYDGYNNRTQDTDANGNTTQYTFDTCANMTQKTDALGQVMNVTYGATNDPIQKTDEAGNATQYSYDANGNLTTATDALGNVITFTYDGYGQMLTKTNALGCTTSYLYDSHGNISSITNALGNTTTYTYDSVGRRLTQTDALGGVTTWAYDTNDNVLSVTDPLGRTTTYQYDENDNKTGDTYPDATIRTFAYDANENLVSVTDERGNTSTYAYDALDQKTGDTDALGNVTTYQYDSAGRLISRTDARGNVTTYQYDVVGNRIGTTGPAPDYPQTQYSYDALNRVTSTTDALGNVTTMTYTPTSLILGIIDAHGNSTGYGYDALGRKVSESDRRGKTTNFAYDAVGNLVGVTDPLGYTTAHTYDPVNNRIATTNALGQQTQYAYDALNRLTQVTDPLGYVQEMAYDVVGNMISKTDQNGNVMQFGYDQRDRLVSVTEPGGGLTQYTYDGTGNLLTFCDARVKTTTYTYDPLNRLISQQNPLGLTRTFSYDAVGNQTALADEDGHTTGYTYDSENRLTVVDYPSDPDVTYVYDLLGRRTSMADGVGTTSYSYDSLGRLIHITDPYGKVLQYAYDAEGNLLTLTYPGAHDVSYTYDNAGRMSTVTDWLGGLTAYTRDVLGRIAQVGLPNGTYATCSYDAAGRLIGQADRKSTAAVIAQYDITVDPVGNRTGTNRTQPLMPPAPTALDEAYTYDGANRILTRGGATYTFSNRGNLETRVEGGLTTTYTFDESDRLADVSNPAMNTTYAYNGDGHRLERTEDGTTTRFVIDPTGGDLWNVLCETDNAGNVLRYYVYGAGLIEMIEADDTCHVYHYNPIGSTVALTDDSETVTDTYAYDEFGKIVGSSGATDSLFCYVGRYGVKQDSDGLLYMRARSYSTETGRFCAVDPLKGDPLMPLSLNPFTYAYNNPCSFSDPAGKQADYQDPNRDLTVAIAETVFSPLLQAYEITKHIAYALQGYSLGKDLGSAAVELQPSSARAQDMTTEERIAEFEKDAASLLAVPTTFMGPFSALAGEFSKAVASVIAPPAVITAEKAREMRSIRGLTPGKVQQAKAMYGNDWLDHIDELDANVSDQTQVVYTMGLKSGNPETYMPSLVLYEDKGVPVSYRHIINAVVPSPYVPEQYEPVSRIVNKNSAKDMR